MRPLLLFCVAFSSFSFAQSPGDIIITEIMNNPSAVTDADGEWFEVYNTTNNAIDLIDCVVSDEGANSFTILENTVVPAGSYFIFGRNADSTLNGGVKVHYEYGAGMTLANSADEIILTAGGLEIDKVAYDAGITFPQVAGASMEFSGLSHTSNDDGSNWSVATMVFGSGDFGTPGALNGNTEIHMASPGDVVITEIMKNPTASTDADGEWFEVYNTTSVAIDMNGWIVSDEGANSFTISTSAVVPPGGYFIFGRNADSTLNGGVKVHYEYGADMILANTDDEVILTIGGVQIDKVAYDNVSFTNVAGASMEFNGFSHIDNDDGANWSVAMNVFGTGDLGTPGGDNDNLVLTEIMESSLSELTLFPNPCLSGTLYVSSNRKVDVMVYDLLGNVLLKADQVAGALDVSSLKQGVYNVMIIELGKNYTSRLTIE